MRKSKALAEKFDLRVISLPRIGSLLPCNPSIIGNDDGFLCLYSGVNYDLKKTGYLKAYDKELGSPSSNELYLVRLNSKLEILSAELLVQAIFPPFEMVDRISDPRLFQYKSSVFFLAALHTSDPASPIGYRSEQALFEMDDGEHRLIKRFASPEDIEKNWTPISDGRGLAFYRSDPPFVISMLDDVDQEELARHKVNETRGGSNVVYFKGSYYAIVHHTRYKTDARHEFFNHYSKRVYSHQLIRFGADFSILARSEWFSFFGAEVEFCMGLDLSDETATISVGVWDQEAKIILMNTGDLLSLLN